MTRGAGNCANPTSDDRDARQQPICAGHARHRLAHRFRRPRRIAHPSRRHQPLHRADALRHHRRVSTGGCRGARAFALPAHRRRGVFGQHPGECFRRGRRGCALSLSVVAARDRDLGRGDRGGAARADVPPLSRDLRQERADHRDDGVYRRPRSRHPQDARGTFRHATRADQRGQEFQSDAVAAVLEDPVSRRAADHLRRAAARPDLRAHQHRWRRISDQFRRPWPAYQRACRALRSCGNLCGDLFRDPGEHLCVHPHREARAMAQTGGLTLQTAKSWGLRLRPVTALRIAIIVAVVVLWEAVSASGWLYRDVVPSLGAIGRSLYATLSDPTFYFHLGTTAYEIGIAMLIGGVTGLAVGLLLGGSKFMSRAYEAYLYYLGPCPKIIFFPLMIMWFGVGPGSKVAMGAISCFFPVALNVAGGMREIDKVLIRVGKSFRANTWQMVCKIYLPAMHHPVINGVRLGLGVALIGTLLAETKLSNRGIGFLVIQAYSIFNMPQMYALLIILFVIAIGANTLIGRFGGLDEIKQS